MHRGKLPYRFVSTDLGVILNIAFGVLAPEYWMIIGRPEELCNISRPCFNGVKPFIAEHMREVSLNGKDGSRSNMVTEDPERCDGL